MKRGLYGVVQHLGVVVTLFPISMGALAQFVQNPPSDRPLSIQAQQAAKIDAAIAPYVAEARKSYAVAKLRFLQGLPPGQTFFVTAQLRDVKGHSERVFIRVAGIRGSVLSGPIANEIMLLDGFEAGQRCSVDESEILDWLITKPDRTEDGNFVGKFLDI